jgi:cell fate regulator YaaT (PSP1 superfamily)
VNKIMDAPAEPSLPDSTEELPKQTEAAPAIPTSGVKENGPGSPECTEKNGTNPDANSSCPEPTAAGDRVDPVKKVKKHEEKVVTSGKRVIGLLLPDSFMVYRVAANFPELATNDSLLLQTRDGEVIGRVVYISSGPPEKSVEQDRLFPGKITRIIRKLSQKDLQAIDKKNEVEKKAKVVCRQTIRELKLPMKLAKVTYQHKGSKVLFHFTSEGRIDFRELVRQLGTKLKTRIEMRHVGVRDETRLLSGVGPCGKELCCSQYLRKFHPVSVRMAKNQDLSLNPDGISGVCGRLLCCLAYENDTYAELKKGLPKVKKCCWTQGGQEATVKCVHTLSGMVTVQHKNGICETLPATKLSKEKPPPLHDEEKIQDSSSTGEVLACPAELNKQRKNKSSEAKSPRPEAEPDGKAGVATKSERKKRRRRRKRGKGKGEVGVNAQAPRQDGSTTSQVNSQANSNPPEQVKQVAESKEAGEKARTSTGKRRRRRRRRQHSGGEGGGSSGSPQ